MKLVAPAPVTLVAVTAPVAWPVATENNCEDNRETYAKQHGHRPFLDGYDDIIQQVHITRYCKKAAIT
jgi:hypothetical protein